MKKTQDEFKAGKNEISYISSDFEKDFYGMEFTPSKEKITSNPLGKYMTSEEIQKEINPGYVTLGEIYTALTSGQMDKEVWGYLAYVKNKQGVGRLVRVGWGGDGWRWLSGPLDYRYEWGDGHRVFSGNSRSAPQTPETLSPLDPLTLEIAEIKLNGKTYRLQDE